MWYMIVFTKKKIYVIFLNYIIDSRKNVMVMEITDDINKYTI